MTSPIIFIESLIQQLNLSKDKKNLDQLKAIVYSLQSLPPSTLEPNIEEFTAASKLISK